MQTISSGKGFRNTEVISKPQNTYEPAATLFRCQYWGFQLLRNIGKLGGFAFSGMSDRILGYELTSNLFRRDKSKEAPRE